MYCHTSCSNSVTKSFKSDRGDPASSFPKPNMNEHPWDMPEKQQSMKAPSRIRLGSCLSRRRHMASGLRLSSLSRTTSSRMLAVNPWFSVGCMMGLPWIGLAQHVQSIWIWGIWRPGQPSELFITAHVTLFLKRFYGAAGRTLLLGGLLSSEMAFGMRQFNLLGVYGSNKSCINASLPEYCTDVSY